jgi:hypothetical protein
MRSRDLFAGGLYLSIPGTIAVVTGGVLLGTTHTGDFAKPLGGYGLLVAGAPAVAAGVIMSVVGAWQVPLRRVDGAPAVYVGPGTASLRWSF